ncbi:hypothetical protein Hanom_Chr10g00913281 [Helianthus anomalus]
MVVAGGSLNIGERETEGFYGWRLARVVAGITRHRSSTRIGAGCRRSEMEQGGLRPLMY